MYMINFDPLSLRLVYFLMATDQDGRNFEVLDVRSREQGHNLDWLRRLAVRETSALRVGDITLPTFPGRLRFARYKLWRLRIT